MGVIQYKKGINSPTKRRRTICGSHKTISPLQNLTIANKDVKFPDSRRLNWYKNKLFKLEFESCMTHYSKT